MGAPFHRICQVNTADAKDVTAVVRSSVSVDDVMIRCAQRYNALRNRIELVEVNEAGPVRVIDYRPLTRRERAKYGSHHGLI